MRDKALAGLILFGVASQLVHHGPRPHWDVILWFIPSLFVWNFPFGFLIVCGGIAILQMALVAFYRRKAP